MRPDLNIDRKGTDKPGEFDAHNKLYVRLRGVVTKFEDDFKTYRRMLKNNLYV